MAEAVEPARLLEILRESVGGLDACAQRLFGSFQLPERVEAGGLRTFRYRQQDDLLLSYLKLVKIASHNNAAIVLLDQGYVQEVYAVCRMIDEACEDITFMAMPLGEAAQSSAQQRRFINEFFQEECSDSEPDPVKGNQSRDRVSRAKVRAGISGIARDRGNPSDEVAVGRVLSNVFSGYVHGAYVHLMEMFGGNPPQFHTRGMLGTPRIQECLGNHANHVYRSLLAAQQVGTRAYREDVVYLAIDLSIALARQTKCVQGEAIEAMEGRRKRPLVKPA